MKESEEYIKLQIEAVDAAPSESAEQVSAAAGPGADATLEEPSQKKLRYAQPLIHGSSAILPVS